MKERYSVKCRLVETYLNKDRIIHTLQKGNCLGYTVDEDSIKFFFADKGSAMMVFLTLESFMNTVSVKLTPILISDNTLKGYYV